MPSDPRPHTARRQDGTEHQEVELRFQTIFSVVKGPQSPRPTDEASMLAFLQELHDRMSGRVP